MFKQLILFLPVLLPPRKCFARKQRQMQLEMLNAFQVRKKMTCLRVNVILTTLKSPSISESSQMSS